MMVRLVKGAYWDTEIKRAQERGLDDYPVFTRKAMTDLNYIACAQRLLALRPRLFPQFATHNALTVATVPRTCRWARRIRVSAPAWHGRGAVRAIERRSPHAGLSDLCAGRQSSRPPGLSGAAPARERRQFLIRGYRRRRHGAGHDIATSSGRYRRHRRQCPASEHPSAARSLSAAAPEFARHRIRRARGIERNAFRCRCGNRARCRSASDQRHTSGRRSPAASVRSTGQRSSEASSMQRRRRQTKQSPPRARDSRTGAERVPRRVRKSWREPQICWKAGPRILSRCCSAKAAKRSMTRSRKSAKPWISAATTPPRDANCSARARRCRAPPARAMCCAARPRRVRRDLAVEFSAGDLRRASYGRADGRQCGRRQTCRTNAADRRRGHPVAA